MELDTIITGGTVVTGQSMFDAAVAIDDGTVVGVGSERSLPEADRRIDATGLLVLPGVVDPHVHLAGYNSVDSYESGTAAAAAGGVTSVVNFAWQGFQEETRDWCDDGTLTEAVDRHREKMDSVLVDAGLHPVITSEDPAVFDELPALVEAGFPSFKMFTTDSIRLSHGFMEQLFDQFASLGAVGMVHTEDHSVCERRTQELKESPSPTAYSASRPPHSEAMAADSAVRLALEADAKYYGVHTTSGAATDVIRSHKRDGSNVRAETCTHYTVFDERVYERLGNLAIMAPPLRDPEDIEALYDGLRDGTLTIVSSDHVAATRERKEQDDWWDSPKGVNSLQTGLSVFHDEAVIQRDFSYPDLVRLKCERPAQTFGMPMKGRIEPGADADIVLFDPDETYSVSAAENHSKADFSIYEGRELTGRVKKTLLRGKLVADNGEIVADPGHGELLARTVPRWGHD